MTLQLRFLLALVASLFLLTACPGPKTAVCGNGKVEGTEACDDGNTTDGDGCQADCTATPAVCGNGVVEGTEACDDGNVTVNDGCEPDCTVTSAGAVCGNGVKEAGEQCDDHNTTSGDGCEANCTLPTGGACGDGVLNQGETCDDGNTTGGDGCEADCKAFTTGGAVLGCPGLNAPAPTSGTCTVVTGDQNLLVTGVILGDGTTWVGGQVLIDSTGVITCAGCDCSTAQGAAAATQLVCPKGVVSPGLINSHDHISFQGNPYVGTAERYEHRHDWRKGNNGHTPINNGGNATNAQVRWAELRQVMAGTTSIVGATYTANGNKGLLRNLDAAADGQEGLAAGTVNSDTFPLGDSAGLELTSGCGYPKIPSASTVPANSAYLPHVAEGIEASALNEFTCISGATSSALGAKTGIVHGIGITAPGIGLVAQTRTSLIWSPRSNVSLYGNTAAIPLYKKLGVNIALGTDWTISGSMNLLRELKCADSLNATRFDHALTDVELWRTVTAGAADADGVTAKLGRLAQGKVADLAIFRRKATGLHRSVIDADPADVVLTMRGGKVLYGDTPLVNAFDTAASCESLDVCGTTKSVCVKSELAALPTGSAANTLALLQAANGSTYPLFSCTAPTNEPSCTPERAASNVKNGSTTYTSPAASGDQDDDGVPDAQDDCPTVFNPVRPMDNTSTLSGQADADKDGVGDVCDPCPLDANTTSCATFDPNDLDGDGVPNATDKCPTVKDSTNADTDGDGKGDVCDPCPTVFNPGTAACPSTIYAVKSQTSPLGVPVALGNVLVTAVGTSGFFLQVHESESGYTGRDYSAVFAYAPSPTVAVGDRLDLATVTPTNFNGQIQLTAVPAQDAGLTVVTSGNAAPAPVAVSSYDLAANDGGVSTKLEGVLVRVDNVVVESTSPDAGPGDKAPYNEFTVSGGLRVNDYLYLASPFPSVGQHFTSITGVLEWRNGNFKIEPRSAADYVSGPPELYALEPAQVFIREGGTTTIPSPLQVRLTNAGTSNLDVVVTAASGEVLVGDGGVVTVASGSVTSAVPLTGVTSTDGGVVLLTATMGAKTAQASVRVLGANEPAHLIGLTCESPVSVGGTSKCVATLDVPAPSSVTLTTSVTPNTLGTAPASFAVLQDATTATFTVTIDPAATGSGTVSVTDGVATQQATVAVQQAGAGHLVISEMATQNTGNASDEFVELYNPTGTAIDISNWKLQYRSAAGTTWSTKATVGANVSVPAHQYFLIASKSYTGPAADLALTTDLQLQASAANIQIVDDTGVVVDKLGYGTGNSPEGTAFSATVPAAGSWERKALPSSTTTTMATGGADAAKGNGTDTDNNANDFVVRNVREPQSLASGATEP